jgi:hypothetical protein
MKVKEKASDLVCDFYDIQSNEYDYGINWEMAKQCAIIVVDEMRDRLIWHTGASDLGNTALVEDIKYWEEVRKEIEKL